MQPASGTCGLITAPTEGQVKVPSYPYNFNQSPLEIDASHSSKSSYLQGGSISTLHSLFDPYIRYPPPRTHILPEFISVHVSRCKERCPLCRVVTGSCLVAFQEQGREAEESCIQKRQLVFSDDLSRSQRLGHVIHNTCTPVL
jgi:hypothetical protein